MESDLDRNWFNSRDSYQLQWGIETDESDDDKMSYIKTSWSSQAMELSQSRDYKKLAVFICWYLIRNKIFTLMVCSLLFMLWDYQRLQRLIYLSFLVMNRNNHLGIEWMSKKYILQILQPKCRLWPLLLSLHLWKELDLFNFPNTRRRDLSVILALIACSGVQIRTVAKLYYKRKIIQLH